MKDTNDQGVGATAFDYSNDQHPAYTNNIYHTNMRVPHPTNNAAKMVNASEIMGQVNEAK